MKSLVRWAVEHSAAMNTLMISVILVGALSATMLRREEFPRFELEIILVTVPYPGASPDEVEQGICQKVEEAVRSVDGIKKVTSVAMEGSGSVILECESDGPDVQKILGEVESEIDRIPSFPILAEEPEVRQLTMRNRAIALGVISTQNAASDSDLRLRELTEQVRDDLLLIPEISVAELQATPNYQIDIEISQATLKQYGLTLQEVANRVRARNLELPGGNLRGQGQEYLLRGKDKRLYGEDIEKIPLVTDSRGVALTVGDLGTVRDEFVDTTAISRINGRPGLAISIEAAAREDLLAMTSAVREYSETKELPPGYEFAVWGDTSIDVRERLELLTTSGMQGLVLVFLILAIFLEFRLAFWVALGIPISVFGALVVLWQTGETLNMLSMFAFLIALGIVVDDAIVIGENIYAHRQMGKSGLKAAIDGTAEVIPSVSTSIATTVFAFMPMFFVTGVMGKFFAVLPIAVIAMLLISLVEAIFILPCHLAHPPKQSRRVGWIAGSWTKFNEWIGRRLDWFINKIYAPTLIVCLRNPALVCCSAVALLLGSFSLVTGGIVPWEIFPDLDARQIESKIIFPEGTPKHVTDAATQRIQDAIIEIGQEYEEREGRPLVTLTHRLVGQVVAEAPGQAAERTEGSHAGMISVELVNNEDREITSDDVVKIWRERVGEIAGAETLSFGTIAGGPAGTPIEFKMLGGSEDMPDLEAAVEACKEKLASYPGVFDITDDSRPGKWELQLTVKDDAEQLGVPLESIAGTVRSAYYGEEVMRLQRGRHEVKLMVRFPQAERESLASLDDIRIDLGDGYQRPLTELADIEVNRGYAEVNRLDQRRSITISADVDSNVANASQIVGELQRKFVPGLLEQYPNLQVRWEGQQEQTIESMQSLFIGLIIALLAMFALLTLEFKSYIQPVIVMAVIPFGIIGALWGHAAMGLPLTLFSVMGLVALTGVVVNDSIVLVDFINHRIKDGIALDVAVMEAGVRRFRPVLLTSLTTIGGLLPILLETSLQAQLLIPMANSLCFGLMLSTVLVLLLVPVYYGIYGRLTGLNMSQTDEDADENGVLDQRFNESELVMN